MFVESGRVRLSVLSPLREGSRPGHGRARLFNSAQRRRARFRVRYVMPSANKLAPLPAFPELNGRVQHADYGAGTVTQRDVFHTVIDFDLHGIRRFRTNLVSLEKTSDPGPTASERRAKAAQRAVEERARVRAQAPARPRASRAKKAVATPPPAQGTPDAS
jgi:hypothetical protein